MNLREKVLYHQIHPLKLAADISSCFASCALLWRRELALALFVAWVPAIAASLLIIRFARLDVRRSGRLGGYVRTMMTPAVTAQRLTGQVVMWLAAWRHEPLTIALGLLVIVLAWLSGLGRTSSS